MKNLSIKMAVNYNLRKGMALENIKRNVKKSIKSKSGEGYVDTAVKILIAVVIGALLLAGIYLLMDKTVLPTVTQKVTDMFNYTGN